MTNLHDLEPEIIWNIFNEICKIPRCSGKEQKLQDWIEKWAENNNINFKKDFAGNILLSKPSSPGLENWTGLMLQAHQDMVCEKNLNVSHDFSIDPIKPLVEDNRVKADGTSLGADNGIGLATAMALLVDQSHQHHGLIEALFTVDEEAGGSGVRALKPGFWKSKRMINLDSEEVGTMIINSCGGGNTTYKIEAQKTLVLGMAPLRLEITGLLGGHSGVDIHLPRYNANKLLGEGLGTLNHTTPISIMKFEGGSRGNVIPRDAYCDFLIENNQVKEALEIIQKWSKNIDRSVEQGLKLNILPAKYDAAYSNETSSSLINLIREIPVGPFSWSKEFPGLVQTSNNLATIKTDISGFILNISSRTHDLEDFSKNQMNLKKIGEKNSAKVEQKTGGSGWKVDPNTPFIKLVENIYNNIFEDKVLVTGIHGGLECATISELDPDLKVVSIGPTIKSPHSPQEYVDIKSVTQVYSVVKKVSENLDKE
jgi:dipeptidase D